MNIINNPPKFYIDKINNDEFFSFSRWGDGEWLCASGVNGMNCDKHIYFPKMKDGLNEALKNNKGYYKAIWNFNHGMIKNNLPMILGHMKNMGVTEDWVNAVVWEDLVIKGGLENLITVLESKDLVIISNNEKRKLNINYKDFIEIPTENCFLEKDRIKNEILELVSVYEKPLFAMSASMATNVIIDELYHEIGDKCWMIDFGSIWDPFIGKLSRSYHKEYIKKEL